MCVECGRIKCFSTGGMMMIMISSGKLIASLLQYNSLLFGGCGSSVWIGLLDEIHSF
jgi:hypothetical protein